MLGTGPLLGQAQNNSWDKPALGTCPLKCLGQARFWDRPFKYFLSFVIVSVSSVCAASVASAIYVNPVPGQTGP